MEILIGFFGIVVLILMFTAASNIAQIRQYSRKQYEIFKQMALLQGVDPKNIEMIEDPASENLKPYKKK